MPLDHYVSQVHLKKFNAPSLDEAMFGVKKHDPSPRFLPCHSRSVCRIENGNTNDYLINDRAVEDFLKGIEPNYNDAVDKMLRNKVDGECVRVIAGFVAYVNSCSPAAIRINTPILQETVKTTAIMMERQGLLPERPASLGKKPLEQLFADGTFNVDIDPKYPQAQGISAINGCVSTLGNSTWEVLSNTYPDSPFFTSDFPVAIEEVWGQPQLNKVVPLAPDIAIRIIPDIALYGQKRDPSFSKLRCLRRKLDRSAVAEVNRLIVRCAEHMVFCSSNDEWVLNFIVRNRSYRVEAVTARISDGTHFLNGLTQRIVPYQRPS